MISAIIYTRPVHPAALVIPADTTQHEATRLTLASNDAIRIYRETVELEKILINLTCNAMKETYYRERITPHTSTFTEPLSDIYNGYLRTTVTSTMTQLRKKKTSV